MHFGNQFALPSTGKYTSLSILLKLPDLSPHFSTSTFQSNRNYPTYIFPTKKITNFSFLSLPWKVVCFTILWSHSWYWKQERSHGLKPTPQGSPEFKLHFRVGPTLVMYFHSGQPSAMICLDLSTRKWNSPLKSLRGEPIEAKHA